MKKFLQKKFWMQALLLFGLFLLLDLGHTTRAYAFASTEVPVGSVLTNSDVASGTVTDSTGLILYYQISESGTEAYISAYDPASIQGATVDLDLPAKISHEGVEYPVVGVNGGVFANSPYIEHVVFPDSYQWIGAEAFMNCPLVGVTFSDSVEEIRDRAFYGCSKLKEVSLGVNVISIGTGVFANCSSLTQITVANGNLAYCAIGGVLYNYSKTTLLQWPAALSVGNSIQETCSIGSADCPVRVIADRAFEGCTSLKTIEGMYSTVTTIGEKAFYGCTALTSAKIPSTVQDIRESAFGNCPSLVISCASGSYVETYAKSRSISTKVTCTVTFYNEGVLVKTQEVEAGEDADAPALPEKVGYTLTWDKSYTNVQQNLTVTAQWKQNFTVTFRDAYTGQVSEQTSYYGGAVTPPSWTRQGYLLAWDSTGYSYVTGNTTVNAVWLVSLTDVTITEQKPQIGDTRTIGNITYQVTRTKASDPRVKVVNCTKQTLKSVTVPDRITFGGTTFKVTNIGAGAFRDMPNLKTLVLSSNLVKINKLAFYNCPQLKKITLRSKKLTGVGAKAFSKIYVKAKVNVPNAYIKKYRTYLRDAGLSTYATVY